MAISVPSLQRRPPVSLWDPMAIAVFVVWAAVTSGPLLELARGAPWTPRAITGLVALVAFLGLFIARGATLGDRVSLTAQRAIVLGWAASALVACWAFPDGVQPTLLVVVIPSLPSLFGGRALLGVLAVTNGVLAALMFGVGIPAAPPHSLLPLQLFIAYVGFQAFALLAIVSLRQANDARDEAQRINSELLATRRLLSEGARAEERLRLSRELHDVAGHKLTALKMQLALHRQTRGTTAALSQSERLAEELLTDIRGVVSTLRQHEGVDLEQALRALDPHLPGFTVIFALDPAARIGDMRAAEALLRCAQEGLTNALRHGGAKTVHLSLARGPDGIVLRVEDDGGGRVAALRAGNGLRGLQERMREVGGRLDWDDRAPTGLRLSAVLPEQA